MSNILIALKPKADVPAIQRRLTELGLWTRKLTTAGATTGFEVTGPSPPVPSETLSSIEGVASVFVTPTGHPLIDAQARRAVELGEGVRLGSDAAPVLFAGPCSAESPELVNAAAAAAAQAGATVLRGGAYKPRTSPYSFTGHGTKALHWLRAAADANGLLLCTEVMDSERVSEVAEHADILQVGSRNMQNFGLLRAIGGAGKPVLLKRAMSASIDEWLLAGEHLLANGASSVVFCERGITGHDRHTRNLLDLGAVAVLAHSYGQPVIVDPSHAVGRRDLIAPLSHAAIAAGAHGVMVEAHPDAGAALSDGPQALDLSALEQLGAALGLAAPLRAA